MDKDSFNATENVASATECTGLVPALPVNDPDAVEDLTRMYAVLTPKRRNGDWVEGQDSKKPGETPRKHK